MNAVKSQVGFTARCFRVALPLIVIVAVATWLWLPAGLMLGMGALFLLWVHRCPRIRCPRIPGAIGAPCDGFITIGQVDENQSYWIRLTPRGVDCRILRVPISGRVVSVERTSGGQQLEIEGEQVICKLTITGGYRLLGWPTSVSEGCKLDAGEAIGLVPLGGSVTMEIPAYANCKVARCTKAHGGRTILAIAFEEDLRKGRVVSRTGISIMPLAETG